MALPKSHGPTHITQQTHRGSRTLAIIAILRPILIFTMLWRTSHLWGFGPCLAHSFRCNCSVFLTIYLSINRSIRSLPATTLCIFKCIYECNDDMLSTTLQQTTLCALGMPRCQPGMSDNRSGRSTHVH